MLISQVWVMFGAQNVPRVKVRLVQPDYVLALELLPIRAVFRHPLLARAFVALQWPTSSRQTWDAPEYQLVADLTWTNIVRNENKRAMHLGHST